MSFFDWPFRKKGKKKDLSSLCGISLGMTKEEVVDRRGSPLEKTEDGVIRDLESWGYEQPGSLHWLIVSFYNDKVVRVDISPKIKGIGLYEENISCSDKYKKDRNLDKVRINYLFKK